MSYLVKIKDYVKKYKEATIKHKNIVINEKMTIIIGGNGSGKSTLLKSIVGLNQYEGEINHKGTFSYMSEHPIFPKDCSVKVFLDTLKLIDRREYKVLLKTLNLENKLNSKIDSLSKGMKVKLNLIQCLMKEADVYILDEPFNGLDKDSTISVIKMINQSNKSFIITTHIDNILSDIKAERIYI